MDSKKAVILHPQGGCQPCVFEPAMILKTGGKIDTGRLMTIRLLLLFGIGLLSLGTVSGAEKRIAVFVGLADNASQGIAPVGKKIGDGNVPEENLYWGCTDGFKDVFKRSKAWTLVKDETATGNERILERMTFHHATKDAVIVGEAWRGSKLSDCLRAMEAAAISGEYDLVAFIGHNGLMDELIDAPAENSAKRKTEMVVLCCKSQTYFLMRHTRAGLEPALYTADFMYPGAFILRDALEPWLEGKGKDAMRNAAGAAYARNQKIKVAAATGVFAKLP